MNFARIVQHYRHILLFVLRVSDAYKDNFVNLNDFVRGKVVRPNIQCTNGYIHLVDTVMLDDAKPWVVIANGGNRAVVVSSLGLCASCFLFAISLASFAVNIGGGGV